MQVDAQIISVVVPAMSAIITAAISGFAMTRTALPQKRLLADMEVYDRLVEYHRKKWLDYKEQEAFMYLRATIGAQIRKLYLYDYDRMLRWMRVSGVIAVVLTAVFAILVNNIIVSIPVAMLLGCGAPMVSTRLFKLKTRKRDESLKSLAEGPWSDAEQDERDSGEASVNDGVGAYEDADICEETLHS